MTSTVHARELELRRLRAGEILGFEEQELRRHLTDCVDCRQTFDALEAEDRAFQQAVPFERFEPGVRAKAEQLEASGALPERERKAKWPVWLRTTWAVPLVLTAMMMVVVVVRSDELVQSVGGGERANRIKGTGASITLRIAGADDGPQRSAAENGIEALAPGERIRIGYRAGPHRYLLALSIDANGEVTPLYPERGESLMIVDEAFLPDSVEFTGTGAERVIVLLTDEPVSVDQATDAARRAFTESDGQMERLPELDLDVEGEQFHQTFLKP